MYLLTTPLQEVNPHIRATAGLMLKNNIRSGYGNFQPQVKEYIKSEVLKGLVDETPLIRNITGNVITTIVNVDGITGWPDVLPQLMSMVENGDNNNAQVGAISALSKICEDNADKLDQEYNGERPLNYMVPKLLQFINESSSPKIRSGAVFCLIQFACSQSQAILSHLDAFLNALFNLAVDRDRDTRRNICTAFVTLLEVRPDKLVPHLEGVINFSLHCVQDDDEQVASEGCEFILGLAESTIEPNLVRQHLPKILPVILSTMVYSEDDRMVLESLAEDDEKVEDRSEDIKPINAKSKDAHHVAERKDNNTNSNNNNSNNDNDSNDNNKSNNNNNSTTNNNNEGRDEEDDDDDDDDDEDDLEAGLAEWNLRKCSAAALDLFTTQYADLVLEVSLPHLKNNIISNDWYVREASILAFGAVAEGGIGLMNPELPTLIPFLVERLGDDQAPVRQISCWTIGRYGSWIVEHNTPETHQQVFVPVLQGLLKCCLDKNKKVQESGCSAFATFTESAGEELVPYLEAILMHLSMCFKKYQSKNLIILYDAIQTLTDHLGTALAEQKYIDLLLPPLIEKWGKLNDDDHNLWPLLECMSSVTATLGEKFAPYAAPVFERSLRILRDNLMQDQDCQVDPSIDPPEKDFIITALDLLDGLVQGLGNQYSSMISQSQPPLIEMMLVCFQDPVYEVRQSAFALLGDMAIMIPDQLRPYLAQLMNGILPQIDSTDPAATAVCNNAIWSVGEISLRFGRSDLEQYSQPLFERLVAVLQSKTDKTVLENAAIAIGRLGKTLADVIAPHIQVFILQWCNYIKNVEETDEKDSAFQGMCQIVGANPSGLSNEGSLLAFIEVAALYVEPSQELATLIGRVLEGYKSYVQDWDNSVMNQLPPYVANSLRQRYQV